MSLGVHTFKDLLVTWLGSSLTLDSFALYFQHLAQSLIVSSMFANNLNKETVEFGIQYPLVEQTSQTTFGYTYGNGEIYKFFGWDYFRWFMIPVYISAALLGIVTSYFSLEIFIWYCSPENADL